MIFVSRNSKKCEGEEVLKSREPLSATLSELWSNTHPCNARRITNNHAVLMRSTTTTAAKVARHCCRCLHRSCTHFRHASYSHSIELSQQNQPPVIQKAASGEINSISVHSCCFIAHLIGLTSLMHHHSYNPHQLLRAIQFCSPSFLR